VHFQVRIGVFNCQEILTKISFVVFCAEMLQQFPLTPKGSKYRVSVSLIQWNITLRLITPIQPTKIEIVVRVDQLHILTTLLTCSQAEKTRDSTGLMSVFTREWVSSTDLPTKHISAGALIHRQQTICWISAQTKLSSIYSHKIIVIYCALMKHQALFTIQAKLKLGIKLITSVSKR